jgi:hypothetical protein
MNAIERATVVMLGLLLASIGLVTVVAIGTQSKQPAERIRVLNVRPIHTETQPHDFSSACMPVVRCFMLISP